MSAFSYKNPPKLRPMGRGGVEIIPVATARGWENPITHEVIACIPNLNVKNADAVVVPLFTLSLPANGTYLTGQTVTLTVAVSEGVAVTGNPVIGITLTSGVVYATYDPVHSISNSLLFKYVVASGDMDMNGITIDPTITLTASTASKKRDAIVDIITGTGGEVVKNLSLTVPNSSGILIHGV